MLRAAQLETLTDFAVQLHGADDYARVAQIAVAAIERLFSCEHAVVSMVPAHFPADRHCQSTGAADWNRHFSAYYQFAHADPIYTHRLRLLLGRPAHDLEFACASELAKTDLYGGLWRSLGAARVMSSINPGPFSQFMTITRGAASAFTRDDVTLLGLLSRHLVAATEQLIARNGWGRRFCLPS